MGLPRFLAENLFNAASQFTGHNLSANEEATGRDAFRVADNRRTKTFWTPTTENSDAWVKVDAGADAGHGSPADGAALRLGYDEHPYTGDAEENLIRDAAMDTDTDGDGVVDGFSTFVGDADVTFSLNSTAGAQRISLADTSDGDETAWAQQFVLRVFPGDEVTISADVRALNVSGSPKARLVTKFEDSGGADLSTDVSTNVVGQTSFGRVALTLTAPDDTTRLLVTLRVDASADGDAVDFDARDARVLRASSDPATWSNPHVSGGSQTGDTLNTSGWPADQENVVREGDWIRPGGSGASQSDAEDDLSPWMRVAADADADSSGDATIQLTDSLTGRSANMIVLDRGHNLRGETVTLETSPDDSTWTEVFSVTIPDEVTGREDLSRPAGVLTSEGAWIKTFDRTGARYWRLTVSAMGSGEKPEIYGLWLGASWQPNFHLRLPFTWGQRRLVGNEATSDIGWRGLTSSNERREAEIGLRLKNKAEYDDFARYHIEELYLSGEPMWIVFDEDKAERTWLSRISPGRTGFQVPQSGWGFQEIRFPAVEHQAALD